LLVGWWGVVSKKGEEGEGRKRGHVEWGEGCGGDS